MPVDRVFDSDSTRQLLTVLQYVWRMHRRENLRLVEILLRRGADVNSGAGGMWSPLCGCVRTGNLAFARLLVDFGAERGDGGSLLESAEIREDKEMV